jgi:hypothetical protein
LLSKSDRVISDAHASPDMTCLAHECVYETRHITHQYAHVP